MAALAATVLLLGGTLREAAPAEPRTDTASLVELGRSFQQRWRETADASYLARSEAALERALRSEPDDPGAIDALASLALARHEFRKALALGRRAGNLGVIGDALAELGRYPEAFRTFDTFVARQPGLASYSRVAYGRELIGDVAGAIGAMELALAAAPPAGEPIAWSHVELARLHFARGDVPRARRHARAALAVFPGYVYALDALARFERSIPFARRAVQAAPLPQFVATLADLYRASGRERGAREQYALIGAIERILRANGVRTDLETALFDIDHGLRLPDALARARRAHRQRPSIEADDVLAWALHANGRCDEALHYSRRALRLGTRDAAKFFHRGMIERCLGRPARAREWFRRSLATNPRFSIVWAAVAERYANRS